MEKEMIDFVAQRADVLAVSPASKQDTQQAAAAWKEAVAAGADADAETAKLLDFLQGRMLGIDDLIAFLEGPGAGLFGEEQAAAMLVAQKQRKEQGEKYCNCEAHAAAEELLTKFGRI